MTAGSQSIRLILAVLLTGAVAIFLAYALLQCRNKELFLKQATGPLLLVLAALAYAGAVLVLTRAYRQIRS